MYFDFNVYQPRNTATIATLVGGLLIFLQLLIAPAAKAVEELSARELGSHCALLNNDPEGVDAQYCIRYIQGFIDGAVATDARVMLSVEDILNREETFSERAIRTRMPSSADRSRAANLAGFCLGDPLPLRDVVDAVVADLDAIVEDKEQETAAMEIVYASLKRHFPCEP
jgi:hypothetical protein